MHSSLDPCTIIRVQSWNIPESVPPQVERALGIRWPREAGTLASGSSDVLCLGPADWLLIEPEQDHARTLRILIDAFQATSFRATNVSASLTRLQIQGKHVRALLSKACALHLHPRLFPPDRVARTCFAGIPVVIRCIEPANFECIVTLSYCDYLTSWLSDAAVELDADGLEMFAECR